METGYIVIFSNGNGVQKAEFNDFYKALEFYTMQTANRWHSVIMADNAKQVLLEYHYCHMMKDIVPPFR
ncbi:MAG: hypothetical protein IKM30_05330 [Oscillospiraceae bacterium]|nr:hypothetical protein [Oscillospiraceae bacterium]